MGFFADFFSALAMQVSELGANTKPGDVTQNIHHAPESIESGECVLQCEGTRW